MSQISNSSNNLIACSFTREELLFIRDVMTREDLLTKYVQKQLNGLEFLKVGLYPLPRPNILGKLLSYIKKAETDV